MLHTQPTCGACDYKGPQFMYMPHGSWGFGVLVQDIQTLGLRVVVVPNGTVALQVLDGVEDEVEAERVWAEHVASLANPPLTPTERVVSIREFMHAAMTTEPVAAELPCPRCRTPLLWRWTGIS